MIAVGTRVSYEDMANPRREGSIVGEVSGQWAVVWDAEYAAEFGLTTATVPVPKGDDVVLVEFHATVTKQMLERAAERQKVAGGRVGGWNVSAATEDELDYDVGSIVEYRARGGGLRRVRVILRSDDFKDGRAGFDGELLNMTDEPTGQTVWGYDEQIVRVDETATASGFVRKTDGLYVYSHGNLVKREQARTARRSVWIPVVGGEPVRDGFGHPMEFRDRAAAERVVLEALAEGAAHGR